MLTRKNKKLVREAILKYVQEKVDSNNFDLEQSNNPITMEGYYITNEEVFDAISNIVHSNSSSLTDEEKREYFKLLKEDECFQFDGYNLKVLKVPLEFRLSQKFKITIDTISEHAVDIFMVGAIILAIPAGVLAMQQEAIHQKSVLVNNTQNYNMKDIYVVYNADDTYFCTRRENKEHRKSITKNYYLNENGKADMYHYYTYIDDIYDYFDIKKGEKICSSDDDEYRVEELLEFYTVDQLEKNNYKFDIKEVEKYINNDYLSSNDSYIKMR